MEDWYIREGIRLANSRYEQAIRTRKAEEYSASCRDYDAMWENIAKLVLIGITVGAWTSIFAHML